MKYITGFFVVASAACVVQGGFWTDPETGLSWEYQPNGYAVMVGSGCLMRPTVGYTQPDGTVDGKLTGKLVIPSKLDGYDNTAIQRSAFHDYNQLSSIEIPSSVTEIGFGAFQNCSSMTSITIPDSVLTIDWMCFGGCSSLPEIHFPDHIPVVGQSMFQGCSKLKAFEVPSKVTQIEPSAFTGCTSLEKLIFKGTTMPTLNQNWLGDLEEKPKLVVWAPKGYDESSWTQQAAKEGFTLKFYQDIADIGAKTSSGVPHSWLDDFGLVVDGDYEAAANAVGVNGRPNSESYVIGLNPNDPKSQFVAKIQMVNGRAEITWKPDLKAKRVYTVQGKERLSDKEWGPRKETDRFFRVKVNVRN